MLGSERALTTAMLGRRQRPGTGSMSAIAGVAKVQRGTCAWLSAKLLEQIRCEVGHQVPDCCHPDQREEDAKDEDRLWPVASNHR